MNIAAVRSSLKLLLNTMRMGGKWGPRMCIVRPRRLRIIVRCLGGGHSVRVIENLVP